jgi:hypothetical protein
MNKEIVKLIEQRLEKGKREYADELDPEDGRDWIKESIEEMLDSCVYLATELLRIHNIAKKPHSKERKKFQEKYIDMIIETTPILQIIHEYKIWCRQSLYKQTDEEFVKFLESKKTLNGIDCIEQWDDFIEFKKHIAQWKFLEIEKEEDSNLKYSDQN